MLLLLFLYISTLCLAPPTKQKATAPTWNPSTTDNPKQDLIIDHSSTCHDYLIPLTSSNHGHFPTFPDLIMVKVSHHLNAYHSRHNTHLTVHCTTNTHSHVPVYSPLLKPNKKTCLVCSPASFSEATPFLFFLFVGRPLAC